MKRTERNRPEACQPRAKGTLKTASYDRLRETGWHDGCPHSGSSCQSQLRAAAKPRNLVKAFGVAQPTPHIKWHSHEERRAGASHRSRSLIMLRNRRI